MLLQFSIALTIKNLTILTFDHFKLKCDEASTGQLYDWVSWFFPLLKAKARMRFVLFIFFSVFEYEINTPPRVL